MPQDIILDLGPHGQIAVEPAFTPPGASAAGLIDDLRASLATALVDSLVGFGQAMMENIPDEVEGAAYELNQFSLEFNVGLGAELGADGGVTGVVAKVMNNGNFKCTYSWSKK